MIWVLLYLGLGLVFDSFIMWGEKCLGENIAGEVGCPFYFVRVISVLGWAVFLVLILYDSFKRDDDGY